MSKKSKVGAVNTKPVTPKPARVRPSRSKAAVAERAAAKLAAASAVDPEATAAVYGTESVAEVIENTIAAEPVLTVEQIEAMDRLERLAVAKVENEAMREWKKSGAADDARPATPVLDWMHDPSHPKPTSKKSSKGTTRVALPTFDYDAEGERECVVCLTSLPVKKFPTTAGPNGSRQRHARCRDCRDAAKAVAV